MKVQNVQQNNTNFNARLIINQNHLKKGQKFFTEAEIAKIEKLFSEKTANRTSPVILFTPKSSSIRSGADSFYYQANSHTELLSNSEVVDGYYKKPESVEKAADDFVELLNKFEGYTAVKEKLYAMKDDAKTGIDGLHKSLVESFNKVITVCEESLKTYRP